MDSITEAHATEALGYLSAELASRAGAWDGLAPDWFPEPPEWLPLWQEALDATAESAQESARAFDAAMLAGDRAHLLTVGSPVRGLCLRVTLGTLSRRARWHPWWPDVFLIWKGKRR
jgi:hypothetical protein